MGSLTPLDFGGLANTTDVRNFPRRFSNNSQVKKVKTNLDNQMRAMENRINEQFLHQEFIQSYNSAPEVTKKEKSLMDYFPFGKSKPKSILKKGVTTTTTSASTYEKRPSVERPIGEKRSSRSSSFSTTSDTTVKKEKRNSGEKSVRNAMARLLPGYASKSGVVNKTIEQVANKNLTKRNSNTKAKAGPKLRNIDEVKLARHSEPTPQPHLWDILLEQLPYTLGTRK